MASFATLKDDFEDNSVATAWSSYTIGSATVAETGGRAVFTLPSSTAGTHESGYNSASTYDLTSDSFYININQMVSTAVAAYAFFDLRPAVGSAANALRWIQQSNTIKAQNIVSSTTTDLYSATWSGTTYKYLRIRESGGTTYWDSSSNGTSWTNRASAANPFAVTALGIAFGAGCGNVASPSALRIEDVNLILPALTTNWHWTQIREELQNRHRTITVAIDTASTVQGYVVTADGIDANGDPSGSIRYWSGPMDGGRELTEQTSDAAAKAMAVNLPLDGRLDLPTMIECRVHRVYHRSIDGNAYTLREVYPRRLVQADDIEAESIRAIHIGVIDLDAQHRITAGGGLVQLDDNGVDIDAVASSVDIYIPSTANAVTWTDPSSNYIVYMQGAYDDTNFRNVIEVKARNIGSRTGTVRLAAESSTAGNSAAIQLDTGGTGVIDVTARTVRVNLNNTGDVFQVKKTGTTKASIDDSGAIAADSLNIGSATGAASGSMKLSGNVQPGNVAVSYSANYNASLANNGVMALGMSNFGIALIYAGGAAAIYAIHGSVHTTTEISDPSAIFTNTAGSASSINVYWSGSQYEIENKRGSAIGVRVWLHDSV